MKKLKFLLILVLVTVIALSIVACTPTPDNPAEKGSGSSSPSQKDESGTITPSGGSGAPEDNGSPGEGSQTPSLLDFEGLSFNNETFTYDGTEKSIVVEGAPADAVISYIDNKKIDAGSYRATVSVSKDGYNTWTGSATLTINQAQLGDFTFENKTFEYDGQPHSITCSGNVPKGESVVYSGGENNLNSATNVGSYIITVKIGGKNYVQKTLTATLKIKSTEELLYAASFDGNIYFQNSLDRNRFYVYNSETESVEKVSSDVPTFFLPYGDKLFYLSDALFTKGINSFDGTSSTSLFSISGENLSTDGTYLYYSVDKLFNAESSGIFRVSIADLTSADVDPVPTKLTSAKTSELVIVNGYVYFSNADDGQKLYRVPVGALNATPTLVYNYKVSDFALDGNVLFFTRHITLSNLSAGAAIYSIDLSSSPSYEIGDDSPLVKKISYAKGKYLTIVGDYLYFVNTDMISSSLFGDGIYRVGKNGSDWQESVVGGTLVVDGEEDNLYSLSSDGTDLYYYRASSKHLYRFSGLTKEETDLMEGFTPPEEAFYPSTYYSSNLIYDDVLYFINMKVGGRLYKYDFSTGMSSRITTLEVADFTIHDNVLYYASVRLKTNYDLYSLNLTTGEEVIMSRDKCYHLSFTDDNIYYVNFSGSNTLNRMNYDGTDDVVIFDTESVDDYSLTQYGNKIYFVADNDLYAYDTLSNIVAKVSSNIKNVADYIITADGKLCYTQDNAASNKVVVYDLSANKVLSEISCGMLQMPKSYFVYDGYLYYFRHSEASSSGTGLYRVSLSVDNASAEKIESFPSEYYVSSPVVYDGNLYFTDAWFAGNAVPTSGTCNVIVYNLASGTTTVFIS